MKDRAQVKGLGHSFTPSLAVHFLRLIFERREGKGKGKYMKVPKRKDLQTTFQILSLFTIFWIWKNGLVVFSLSFCLSLSISLSFGHFFQFIRQTKDEIKPSGERSDREKEREIRKELDSWISLSLAFRIISFYHLFFL